MIGNPGTGKSTALNSAMGDTKFTSGVSRDGMGVTVAHQVHEYNGVKYIDSPGLADVSAERRKQAALEIGAALKRDGAFRFVFVVVLQQGRVRDEDLTTMKLVLDALADVPDVQFGVIVNMLPHGKYTSLVSSEEMRKRYQALFIVNNIVPTSMLFLKREDGIEGVDQALLDAEASARLREWLNWLPVVRVQADKVGTVQASAYEAAQAEYKVLLDSVADMKSDNAALLAKVEQLSQAAASAASAPKQPKWWESVVQSVLTSAGNALIQSLVPMKS
jgi:GTP-binding protein EngB required for normal cell division